MPPRIAILLIGEVRAINDARAVARSLRSCGTTFDMYCAGYKNDAKLHKLVRRISGAQNFLSACIQRAPLPPRRPCALHPSVPFQSSMWQWLHLDNCLRKHGAAISACDIVVKTRFDVPLPRDFIERVINAVRAAPGAVHRPIAPHHADVIFAARGAVFVRTFKCFFEGIQLQLLQPPCMRFGTERFFEAWCASYARGLFPDIQSRACILRTTPRSARVESLPVIPGGGRALWAVGDRVVLVAPSASPYHGARGTVSCVWSLRGSYEMCGDVVCVVLDTNKFCVMTSVFTRVRLIRDPHTDNVRSKRSYGS